MLQPVSIPRLAARLSSREVSVERVTTDMLDRIARLNPILNAYIAVLGERALEDARRLDAELDAGRSRGPLHGIPISVKDLIDVEGAPTTAASRVRARHLASADAPVVSRLRQAGAVLIGKTNLHEFAYGTTSEDSAYGAVRNACDPSRSAGGSSGGSATAIAAGLCAGSIGTDTGGSIRIPSAACGVVGLKPTYGEVPAVGVVPLSRSLDHVGPMAADVESVRLLYESIAGATSSGETPGPDGRPMRLGVPRRYFTDLIEAEVRGQFEAALDRLQQAGARVVDVDIPHADLIASVYLHIQLPESACHHAASLERHAGLYSPAVRLRLEMGRYVLAEDYIRARRGQQVLADEVDRALAGLHALVLPTLAIAAPVLGQATARLDRSAASPTRPAGALLTSASPGPGTRDTTVGAELPVRTVMLRLTQLFDVTGHPAISLPMGQTALGLPTGLQLAGRRNQTLALLRCAGQVEATLAPGRAGL